VSILAQLIANQEGKRIQADWTATCSSLALGALCGVRTIADA
jgi:hypothetical protein